MNFPTIKLNKEEKRQLFVCEEYCQSCKHSVIDEKCNIFDAQLQDVKMFELVNSKCKNYISAGDSYQMEHKIAVIFKNGKKVELPNWYSTEEVRKMWEDPKIEYVDRIFSDITD